MKKISLVAVLFVSACATTTSQTNVPEGTLIKDYGKVEIVQGKPGLLGLSTIGWSGNFLSIYDKKNNKNFTYPLRTVTEMNLMPGSYNTQIKCTNNGGYGYINLGVVVDAGKSTVLKCSSYLSNQKDFFGVSKRKVRAVVVEKKPL